MHPLADGPEVSVEVLVDPMAIDPSGLTTLDAWQPDKEGRLLAYQLSEGGDEESLLRVIDVTTGALVDGPIDRCRYSNVAWLPGGKAFYYTRRLPPSAVPDGESQYHRRVYLHQVGTPADEDVLIFGTGRDKTDYYYVSVSRDGRWLVIASIAGHRAAQRPVDRRPVRVRSRLARSARDPGGARRADRRPGRPGRAAVRVHRLRRAPGPDRGDRPGRPWPRRPGGT